MEALELFGDSFLKYAVSRKLFLELKTANEGILSTKRMHRICNRALHQLAVKRGLPVRSVFFCKSASSGFLAVTQPGIYYLNYPCLGSSHN